MLPGDGADAVAVTHDNGEYSDFSSEARSTWARLIRKIFEADPLVCACGARLRILSVITDPRVEVIVESVQETAEASGMTPAFVGFMVLALVGGATEMEAAFSGARQDRLDLSAGIALGSAPHIMLFVAPVLVLLSDAIGPAPMDLQFWPGAVVMILIATITDSLVASTGRSAWFLGVVVLTVYVIFAMILYLLPPRAQ